jgi:hypothetical protein
LGSGRSWGDADNSSSSWNDWSTMAALLSPAHVTSLAHRRLTDLGGPPAAPAATGKEVSFSCYGAGLLGPQRQQQQQQQLSQVKPAGDRGSSWCSSAEAAGGHQPADRPLLLLSRHESLCLDMPGSRELLPLNLSPTGDYPDTEEDSNSSKTAPARKPLFMDDLACLQRADGAGAGGSGSFSFRPHPPAKQQQQQQLQEHCPADAKEACTMAASKDDVMISQPFDMPSFFSCGTGKGAAAAPGGPVSPSAGGNGGSSCRPEHHLGGSSTSLAVHEALSPSSRHLHHSASLPEHSLRGAGPAVEPPCAAVAGNLRNEIVSGVGATAAHMSVVGAVAGGYGEVFRSLWGGGGMSL